MTRLLADALRSDPYVRMLAGHLDDQGCSPAGRMTPGPANASCRRRSRSSSCAEVGWLPSLLSAPRLHELVANPPAVPGGATALDGGFVPAGEGLRVQRAARLRGLAETGPFAEGPCHSGVLAVQTLLTFCRPEDARAVATGLRRRGRPAMRVVPPANVMVRHPLEPLDGRHLLTAFTRQTVQVDPA